MKQFFKGLVVTCAVVLSGCVSLEKPPIDPAVVQAAKEVQYYTCWRDQGATVKAASHAAETLWSSGWRTADSCNGDVILLAHQRDLPSGSLANGAGFLAFRPQTGAYVMLSERDWHQRLRLFASYAR